ncbi:hypothetical protein [Catenulispora rubra]|uniref:hypothetical protein n=1 Tax=Catenulispora rubra TaxID=280293 RepID=UPI0018922B64|nr:hypothetical protein [Catenulispora rubra]
MLLWDEESRPWGERIETLSPGRRQTLCLDAIDLCFASFQPSFEEDFAPETVRFAREAVGLFRGRFGDASLGVPEEQFFDDLYALQENDFSPGTASIVMAISEYADGIQRELSTADVLAILSACYEAVLNSERIPRVTLEAERENQNLVNLIAAQRELVTTAASE